MTAHHHLRAAVAITMLGVLIAPASALAATDPGDDLDPTSAPPWSPPEPEPRRRAWERALTFPGRVVSLPLTGLGHVTQRVLFALEERSIGTRSTAAARDVTDRFGWNAGPARLGDRTGLGARVRVTAPYLAERWRQLLAAELEGSTREYARVRAGVYGHPASLEFVHERRPQERFHGLGIAARAEDRTEFVHRESAVRGALAWGWDRDSANTAPRANARVWAGPRTVMTRDRSDRAERAGIASWNQRFPELAEATLDRRIDHFVWGARLEADHREGVQRWDRGWRLAASAERFEDPIENFALGGASPSGARFTRWSYEGEAGASVMRDPRTLRVFARVEDQQVEARDARFLLGDLASLGGHEGLGGFGPGRFRGRDLAHARVTWLFPLVRRLEMDLHAEWGGVYGDVWEDFRLESLERSLGFAVRGRLKERSWGSVGIDFSREGARVRFALDGVE